MCVRSTIEVEHSRLLYKARGGWNVLASFPGSRNVKLNWYTRREPDIYSHVSTAKGRTEVE